MRIVSRHPNVTNLLKLLPPVRNWARPFGRSDLCSGEGGQFSTTARGSNLDDRYQAVWKSSKETWCALHEDAFAYFGGVTATIRVDNLCEAVIDAAIYDRKSIRSTPVCSSITA